MPIVNGYCSAADLKEHFGDTNLVLNTNLVERAINAASRAIDRYCGRRFWQDPTVQTKTYVAYDYWDLWVDDISTRTGLVVRCDTNFDGSYAVTLSPTDYQLEPLNADTESTAYAWSRIRIIGNGFQYFPIWYRNQATVQVTARFGYSAIPDQVIEACLLKAAALLKRKDSPSGVMGFQDFGGVRISRFDPDVMALLSPYRKVGV